ncbi:MAG: HD domain-containing protein [Actinobacteria bacterium]|nr:HD domain-containing protein [Actinomycetota bacterium]
MLPRYVREWHSVRSKPQRNAYHRYTVDRHLFETAAEAAASTRLVHRPDLLLVAAWLHDIGKGLPGDHTDNGVRLIEDIARRMGFDEEDASTLRRLVRDHLLLPETATRRDLGDPATIERVAQRVGTIDQLELLAALTRADSIATGPTSWGAWKQSLVEELVVKTRAHLKGERAPSRGPEPTPDQRSLMEGGALKLVVDGTRLTVAAPDRRGLLSVIAAVLAANGLSVRAATGVSAGSMAVEEYDIDLQGRDRLDWSRIEGDIAKALDDPRWLEERVRARARSMEMPVRKGHVEPPSPRVIFDNDSTPRATIVEVRAPDGVGVLSRIARAITSSGSDIAVVRALTLGKEVVDTFYVTQDGSKMTRVAQLERLEHAILSELQAES